MALKKTIATRFGINATYWKIFTQRISSDYTSYLLEGFSDKAHSDSNGKYLHRYKFEAKNSNLTIVDRMPTMASLYEQAKLQEEMEGAENA